jgi:hypothetical protein
VEEAQLASGVPVQSPSAGGKTAGDEQAATVASVANGASADSVAIPKIDFCEE